MEDFSVYNGQFENGFISGIGELVWNNGNRYKG